MMTESPLPDESDVHLSVFMHGARLDFRACLTAALAFVQEHQTRHYVDAVRVNADPTDEFPRLPNERLYI